MGRRCHVKLMEACASQGITPSLDRTYFLCPIFQYSVPSTKPRMTVTRALM